MRAVENCMAVIPSCEHRSSQTSEANSAPRLRLSDDGIASLMRLGGLAQHQLLKADVQLGFPVKMDKAVVEKTAKRLKRSVCLSFVLFRISRHSSVDGF